MTNKKVSDYTSQDRGDEKNYSRYLASMDTVSVEKVASASVFFDPTPGNTIVDMGMASGASSNILAHLFPNLTIIGVDINPKMVEIASQTYRLPNLEFRIDDGEKLTSFGDKTINGFFNCSSIHHITSFNGYESYRAYSTLMRQVDLLKTGGIIVVRDFVKPPEMEVILDLSNLAEKEKPSNAELLVEFSKTARSLASPNERGFPLKEARSPHISTRRFLLQYADAVEFIRRKDYYKDWNVELQEEYGYFTQKEFEDVFTSLGLRVIVSYPIYNPWIIRNRYKGTFTLYDKNLNDIGLPPTNYLIAGEKVNNQGKSIRIIRHLPEKDEPFLKYNSFKNINSQKIYDIVQRPNSVVDIIPYCNNNGRIEVIAKHGYPRPIVNVETDSPIIDQKHYCGYITEGLTASNEQPLGQILANRTNLKSEDILRIEKSLEYFTSPGGINEKVESFFVELKESPVERITALKSYSGFTESGTIRKYDAIQLLKTAQTGALAEARLELNIYNLLKKLNIEFPQWRGEKIEIEEMFIPQITTLNEILAKKESCFIPVTEAASYLQKHRVKFEEMEIHDSANILEFVTPQKESCNTLVTLPVVKYNNTIYVGLEIRNLPVPQNYNGNSCIPVAPAVRLSKELKTYKDLENYIVELKIYGTGIKCFSKLGEKFFPSVGITPEQVYPYVVCLNEVNKELHWVSLIELYNNIEKIHDGHLLLSIIRLSQAIR